MSAFNSIPTVKFFVIHVSCVICNICWHSMHVRTVQQEHQDHQLAQHVIQKCVIFLYFLCLYKEDQCNRLIRTAKTRERERGMDALNSTKPDDHQVVSPTRVLLHLSILSINMVSHFHVISFIIFYQRWQRGTHIYIIIQ